MSDFSDPSDASVERCPFCHENVAEAEFEAHCAAHLELRDDGQQQAYATLPADERASEAELANAPRWYRHATCGQVTGMPEEIIRTYLADPWFYSDRTYCCGCESHVLRAECTWEETGENVQSYINRLRAAKPERRPPGIWTRVRRRLAALFGAAT